MAEKVSKTARASLGDKTVHIGRLCPRCNTPMVATRVLKTLQRPGGMYWICSKDDYREKT